MGLGKGLLKGLKGLGKKAGSLGSKLKGGLKRSGGYKRVGQEALLGGTTKSAASRALAPVKARAKSLGAKVRGSMSKPSKKSGGGSGFSNFDGPYKPSTDDGFGMSFESVFPKASRSQRASMGARNMKARASDALESAKGRINEYRTGKKFGGGGGKKSSGPGDFDTTMPFESVFPKASRGQRAKMSLDMAKGRARDMASSVKAKYNKYKQGKSAKAGMASNGNTRYDAL